MSFVRGYWAVVVGVLVLAIGIVPLVLYAAPAVSVGWSAYAPLTSTTFTPGFAPTIWLGAIALGLALIAGWVGYRIGRDRARG